MARSRNIKPGFFKNEDLAECDLAARLTFAGLWVLADREGRLEDRPKRIKGELFAYDSFDVEPLLDQLARHGFIARYEVAGQRLIQILAFAKHQNPHHREAPSVLPAMPGYVPAVADIDEKPGALDSLHEAEARGEPEASPGLSTVNTTSQGVKAVLIPDSGFSDSLIPDSLPFADQPSAGSAAPKPKAKKPSNPGKTVATWQAYAAAYLQRYGAEPKANATVNGMLGKFVDAIGAEEAPLVAAFYLTTTERDYVKKLHPVNLMLAEAQKLRTLWWTGRAAPSGAPATARQQRAAEFYKPTGFNRHSDFDSTDYTAGIGVNGEVIL